MIAPEGSGKIGDDSNIGQFGNGDTMRARLLFVVMASLQFCLANDLTARPSKGLKLTVAGNIVREDWVKGSPPEPLTAGSPLVWLAGQLTFQDSRTLMAVTCHVDAVSGELSTNLRGDEPQMPRAREEFGVLFEHEILPTLKPSVRKAYRRWRNRPKEAKPTYWNLRQNEELRPHREVRGEKESGSGTHGN